MHLTFESNNRIFYTYTPVGPLPNSVTWAPAESVGSGKYPALAVDKDGRVCITWTDGLKVFYHYRNPNGSWASGGPWESDLYIRVETPSIAVDKDNFVHPFSWRRLGKSRGYKWADSRY